MIAFLLLSASVNFALALLTLNRRFHFSTYAFGMFTAFAVYQFGYAMELQAPCLQSLLTWSKVQYLGIPFIPFLWTFFIVGVTRPQPFRFPRAVHGIWAVPVLLAALRLSNEWHGLIYAGTSLEFLNGLSILHIRPGPVYWVQMALHFLAAGITTVLLVRYLLRGGRFRPSMACALGVINLGPFVGLFIYLFFQTALDISPFIASVTGPVFAYALYRLRVFHLSPVAREMIFENMETAIVVLDTTKRVIDFNQAFVLLLPQPVPEPQGKLFLDLHPGFASLPLPPLHTQGTVQAEFGQDHPRYGRQSFAVSVATLPLVHCWTLVFYETTTRKKLEERLRHLSFHDSLTGLYNRTYFEEELQRLRAGRNFPVGIVALDLDGLKIANDSQGHEAGDALLRASGETLALNIRKNEVAARTGGDEFQVLLPSCSAEQLARVVQRLAAAFDGNTLIGAFPLSASIGSALADSPAKLDAALQSADAAMYQAKRQKKNRRATTLHPQLLA
jgi:diguanylate cyclase (GGDEF)-like protein